MRLLVNSYLNDNYKAFSTFHCCDKLYVWFTMAMALALCLKQCCVTQFNTGWAQQGLTNIGISLKYLVSVTKKNLTTHISDVGVRLCLHFFCHAPGVSWFCCLADIENDISGLSSNYHHPPLDHHQVFVGTIVLISK